jgi:acyl carrier protein
MYGITETTVHVTYRKVMAADTADRGGSLIGEPIADLQVYVLDERLEPAPIGVAGEIYVAGAGLARGYLGRAGLTAERFIPNPHGERAGERLYRTGDLGRYVKGWDIEYLGRVDQQVKIRGYRIELGEIKAVLEEHASVRECVVVMREGAGREKQLAAYAVAEPGEVVEASVLREHAKKRLPEYMVPTDYVEIECVPLTSNGKMNVSSLPEPEEARAKYAGGYEAPRTAVEKMLAEIWSEVLEVEQVGVNDNFFDLGGHSLLLTRLASRIREVFEVNLPLRILFDAPTIAEMIEAITAWQIEQSDAAEISQMLEELKNLSPDEINELLEAEGALANYGELTNLPREGQMTD